MEGLKIPTASRGCNLGHFAFSKHPPKWFWGILHSGVMWAMNWVAAMEGEKGLKPEPLLVVGVLPPDATQSSRSSKLWNHSISIKAKS